METSVKAAELVVPTQPGQAPAQETGSLEGEAAASSDPFDPMEGFNRRLQDILRTHGSASTDGLLDTQVVVNVETERTKPEVEGDAETDARLIRQSLDNLSSPEDKLEELVQKFAELAALRRGDEQRMTSLQQKLCLLLEERRQLQAERRSSIAARSKLEALCRDLQAHYGALREETLQRCRKDEEKRSDITNHFQEMLTEIQAQIEQHSVRNDKLRQENANLTDKLESLMDQYERREEGLEKISKHRDLQLKLTEAKLQQANALLTEAEEKHKREKEYLLREAIDKTKKCFAMKEQELAMKKKLTLYAQKFDEFQATLAKSNEIYVRFKKEMDNMTEKMKKVEKEANLWKTRFENCNKTLIDMIEERTEKGREYDLFVLKIQKLEKLCHALQDERKGLYAKIREVRQSSANVAEGCHGSEAAVPDLDGLQELEEEDPVLTGNITRLREEQAKLQEFAASLLATSEDNQEQQEKDEPDAEDDAVVTAIVQFKAKSKVPEGPVPAPDQAEEGPSPTAASGLTEATAEEKVPDPSGASLKDPEPARTKSEPKDPMTPAEVRQVLTQVQLGEVQEDKREEHVQQSEAATSEPGKLEPEPEPEPGKLKPEPEPGKIEPEPEPGKIEPEPGKIEPEPEPGKIEPEPEPGKIGKIEPEPEPGKIEPEAAKVVPQPEALETERLEETREVKPVENTQVQQPVSGSEPGPGRSKPAGSSMKQVQKKRKKRNSKSTS